MRVGLIGAGTQGTVLAASAAAIEGVRLTAVCDPVATNRRRAVRLGRSVRAYAAPEALLEAEDIDAVLIATPDHLHAGLALAAMRAGKDVYLEPPSGRTLAEAGRLLDAARETRRLVQIGYQRRSLDIYREARAIAEAGTIGTLLGARCYWHGSIGVEPTAPVRLDRADASEAWRAFLGSAPAGDLDPQRMARWAQYWDYSNGWADLAMAPQLDAVMWILGREHIHRAAVRAAGSGRASGRGGDVPQAWSAHFEFGGDCPPISCFASTSVPGRGFGEQLVGSCGTIEIANLSELRLWRRNGRGDLVASRRVGSKHPRAKSARPHLAAFLASIRDGAPLVCGPDAAAGIAALTQAALDSYRGGGRPIALAPLRA